MNKKYYVHVHKYEDITSFLSDAQMSWSSMPFRSSMPFELTVRDPKV